MEVFDRAAVHSSVRVDQRCPGSTAEEIDCWFSSFHRAMARTKLGRAFTELMRDDVPRTACRYSRSRFCSPAVRCPGP